VRAYFADRQKDFLVLDLGGGDGWRKVCGFLGDPVPNRPFPHENKGPHSLNIRDRAVNYLRRWTPPAARKAIFSARQAVRDLSGQSDPRDVFNNMAANRGERKHWKQGQSGSE